MRQAELLDIYITILRQNPAADPPADLNPELARAARRIIGARRESSPSLEVKSRVWKRILSETQSPRFSENGSEEETNMEAVLTPRLIRSHTGRWALVAVAMFAILIGTFMLLSQQNDKPGPAAVFISPQETNKQVFQRYIQEVWNEGNIELLGDLTTADFVRHESGAPDVALADLPAYITTFRSAIPDGATSILAINAENDMVYMRGLFTGTFQQPLEFAPGITLPPTGETITFDTITSARFVDGRMAEQWTVLDTLSLMAGLSAAKTPDVVLTEQANEAITRQMIDALNAHQPEASIASVDDNAVWCYGTVRSCGALSNEVRQTWVSDVLLKSFPDLHLAINRLIVSDDLVIAEMTALGTFSSDFVGPWDLGDTNPIPATNQSERWSWLWILQFEDSKIVAETMYWDFPLGMISN